MLRIKAVLILKRNATRDYLDFVAMQDRLGEAATLTAMRSFDRLYPQPNGESPTQQLLVQLAKPMPYDLEETRLSEYKLLAPRWHDWKTVSDACAAAPDRLFADLATPDSKRPGTNGCRCSTPSGHPEEAGAGAPEWAESPHRAGGLP